MSLSTACLTTRSSSKSLLKAAIANSSRSSSSSPCRLMAKRAGSDRLVVTSQIGRSTRSIHQVVKAPTILVTPARTSCEMAPKTRNYTTTSVNPNTSSTTNSNSVPPKPKPGTSSSSSSSSGGGSFVRNALKYSLAVALGTSAGLFTGYYLMIDQYKLVYHDRNQASRTLLPEEFRATRTIEYADSPYRDFPLKIHVYQYESCPYCAQIRAYLDYFGFSYTLTEVDAYEKAELSAFTKARMLPIVSIEDRVSKQRWNLVNASAIISALESLRNEQQHINYAAILDKFLPVMKQSSYNLAKHPNKYMVLNSDLNSIDWRKWVNNQAIPTFRLNSVSTYRDLRETFDYYAEKSGWRLRYNQLKFFYIYYNKMYRAYHSRGTLVKNLENGDSIKKAPRDILNETIEKWDTGLGENLFISGTNKPNLADLSMFGNVKAFEGCALFRESIAKHALFRQWYERMQFVVTKRYQHDLVNDKKRSNSSGLFFPLISLDPVEAQRLLAEEEAAARQQRAKPVLKLDLTQAEVFRVLSITYLVHLVVFTYAAWMGR